MIRVNNVAMRFGGDALFNDIHFQVGEGERIGLTGKNGAGKSTLLKILSQQLTPDTGNIETPNSYTIGYLAQDLDKPSQLTVLEETKIAFGQIKQLEAEIEDIQHQLVTRTDYESDSYANLINNLNDKELILNNLGNHNAAEAIEKVLKGLGFESSDMDKPVAELSGGWQMRIELAKILLQTPDLVLLDEPTNHLDIESIIWLEEYLIDYTGAIILVSHDKTFLDNVTNRTIEIVQGKIEDYKCNYSNYLIQRQDRIEKQQQAKKNQEDYIKQTKQNIEKFRAKKNKAKFAQTLIKKLEKLEIIEVDQTDNSSINFGFQAAQRSGNIVVSVNEASKSFGSKQVLKDVSLEINRGEKVAFVGKNGMGKTTLSKMIVNELEYDGEIVLGHNVEFAYFAQHQADILDGKRTVFETLDEVATGDMRVKVRSILGAFLFSGEDVDKKVSVLSGGERTRLALAKLTLEQVNLLVLDEPTNHLDLRAKAMLKLAIQNFNGTVIVVSHDRDFLEGLTEKVFEFIPRGVKEHIGDINEFLAKRQADNFRDFELNKEKKQEAKAAAVTKLKIDNKQAYAIKKELRSVENKIAGLEKRIAEKDAILQDFEKFKTIENDPSFFSEYEKMKTDLDAVMVRWEEIAEILG